MLHGGLAGKLILFALPLAFSSILQQLFNSADVAVVGRFAGDTALAAVGSCVALVGIFVNLIGGLSVGPNAVLALLIGQNNREEINRTLHTVITFGAALGVGLMIVGWLTAKPILVLSGMPMLAMLPLMMVELCAYGLVAGLLRGIKLPSLAKVVIAQLAGRVVLTAATAIAVFAFGSSKAIAATWTSDLAAGLPGLALQWALIPLAAYWTESLIAKRNH